MRGHILLWSIALTFSRAHSSPAQQPGEPCCAIKSVDVARGFATAIDAKTGRLIRFKPADAAQLRTLKPGQKVWADLAAGKVTVSGSRSIPGFIIPNQDAEHAADVNFGGVDGSGATSIEPCCGITAIARQTGIVTALEKSTGRVFRFEVKDGELLKSLKIGQAVHADFGTSKVSIHGGEPCCNIIGHGPGKL